MDGTKYHGLLHRGERSGFGKYSCSKGTYKGYFKHDKMHGYGKYTWLDDRVYYGQYYNGKKEGLGVFKWPDGRSYEG